MLTRGEECNSDDESATTTDAKLREGDDRYIKIVCTPQECAWYCGLGGRLGLSLSFDLKNRA